MIATATMIAIAMAAVEVATIAAKGLIGTIFSSKEGRVGLFRWR